MQKHGRDSKWREVTADREAIDCPYCSYTKDTNTGDMISLSLRLNILQLIRQHRVNLCQY